MALPLIPIAWAGGAALVVAISGGGYAAGREIGEGIGDGLKTAMPIAAGALAVYMLLEAQK